MNLNTDNKLNIIPIEKTYLENKNFSYKLQINLCYISWWNKLDNRYEFYLNYITLCDIEKITHISRTLISKQLKDDLYRIKNDEIGCKHLYFYTPIKNYISIPIEIIGKLKDLDEMTIRSYIFISKFKSDIIYGLTHYKILEGIGYSPKSRSNESKLTKSIKQLIELGLIKREIKFNGTNRYSIYYKI